MDIDIKWPGEKLAIKMWESLVDKGIGSLFKPRQDYRVGIANNKVEADRIITIAQAEKTAEDIKTGKQVYRQDTGPILIESNSGSNSVQQRTDPYIDSNTFIQVTKNIEIQDSLRREINVSKAILSAEKVLLSEGSNKSEPSQEVEDDWLYSWRDNAGRISEPQLQELWGRVLAGEVKTPGSFSYRTLEFLRGLTKAEADLISILANFEFHGFIFKDAQDVLDKYGLTFQNLLILQEIGILDAVDGTGVAVDFKTFSSNKFMAIFKSSSSYIKAEGTDINNIIRIYSFYINKVGKEVMKLTTSNTPDEYLDSICKNIEEQGFTVVSKGNKPN